MSGWSRAAHWTLTGPQKLCLDGITHCSDEEKKKWNYEKTACALQFNLMWKPKVRIWISCWLKFQSGDCSSTSSQMTWRAEKSGQQSKQGCFVQNWLLWTKCQVNCSITAVIYWLLKKMCFQTQVCCGELCGCSAWKKKKKKKTHQSSAVLLCLGYCHFTQQTMALLITAHKRVQTFTHAVS